MVALVLKARKTTDDKTTSSTFAQIIYRAGEVTVENGLKRSEREEEEERIEEQRETNRIGKPE